MCFLGFLFLITFLPLNNLIMPYFYLMFCHKPIRDIVQQPWIHVHCLIAHFLYFEVVGDIPKVRWICLNNFFTHVLCFKAVRNMVKCIGHRTHYLVAHLHGFQMIWDKIMHSLLHIASLHISWVLRWSETYANKGGSIFTASMHISCV